MNYDDKFRRAIESVDSTDPNDEYFQLCIEYISDYFQDFSEKDKVRSLLKIIKDFLD